MEEGKGNLRVRNVGVLLQAVGVGNQEFKHARNIKEEKQVRKPRREGTCTAQSQAHPGSHQACAFPVTHRRAAQSRSSPGKGKALPEMSASCSTMPRPRPSLRQTVKLIIFL